MAIPKSTNYGVVIRGVVVVKGSKRACRAIARMAGGNVVSTSLPIGAPYADTGPTTNQIMANVRRVLRAA